MFVDPAMPILVVDDYQTMVRIIRNLLKQVGFENVDDASNGEDALAKLRSKNYAFIMVTAESKTDNVVAARNAGVSHYIVKPFNAGTLKAKIDAVFAPVAA